MTDGLGARATPALTTPVADDRPPDPTWALRPILLLAAYALAIVVAVLRRPDFVLNAQFWAEDGPVWFAQAHALGGLGALPLPYAGYYHLFPRLAGALGAAAGVRYAPLTMNALSVLAYAVPVPLALMLARSRRQGWFLLFCAALYLFLPYSRETHFSATTAIWPLALSLFLLAMHPDDRRQAAGRDWLRLVGLAFCGLSGPFAVFLLPAIALRTVWPGGDAPAPRPWPSWSSWPARPSWPSWPSWLSVAVLGACAAAQLTLLASGMRNASALGGVPAEVLMRIVGRQIVAGGLLGEDAVHVLSEGDNDLVYALLALLYAFVVVRGAVLGDGRLRAFLLYAHLILAAGILFAPASEGGDILVELLSPQNGQRYWLLSTLGFLVSAAWIVASSRVAYERIALAALLPAFLIGSARDFAIPPLADLRYGAYADWYCALPLGEPIEVPVNPEGWQVDLVRKPDRSCP